MKNLIKSFNVRVLRLLLISTFTILFVVVKSQEIQLEPFREDSLNQIVLSNSANHPIVKVINFTDSIADLITYNSKSIDSIINVHNQQNIASSNKYSTWSMFFITCAIFLGTMIYYWVSHKSQKRQFDQQNENYKEQLIEQRIQFTRQIDQQKDQFDKDLDIRKVQLEKQLSLNKEITEKQLLPIIGGYAIGGNNSKEVSFVIENYGGGPAIINSISFKNLDLDISNANIKQILNNDRNFEWDESWSFTQKEYYLYPKQKRILYKLTLDKIKKELKCNEREAKNILKHIRNQRNNLLLTIKYKGVYGEKNHIYKYPTKLNTKTI